jgi:glycosyltransferase involved in cell wall biosynthesis
VKIPAMDYIIVTRNDIDTIRKTIRSIIKQSNVNRIVVVLSESSSDGTANLMDSMLMVGMIDKLLTEDIGLGYARVIGIAAVETEYFVFVDGDVVLKKNWIEDMWKYMADDIGGIQGILVRNKIEKEHLSKYNLLEDVTVRLFTHNTIIRTDVARTWRVDRRVNAFEDYLLTQYICGQGYKCIAVPVISLHDHRGSDFKSAIWGGTGMRITGYATVKDLIIEVPLRIYSNLKRTIRERNLHFLTVAIKQVAGIIVGYFDWNRYYKDSGR